MTDTDLRNLFHDAAPDPDRPDPAAIDRAWRLGTRRRVGARAAVVVSMAATAAAVTGVAVLDRPFGQVAPGPAPTNSPAASPSSPEQSGPVATYGGAPVWLAPRVEAEPGLPLLEGTSLPAEIDLSVQASSASGIGRAVGVIGVWPDGDLSRVVAVGVDGATYSIDIGDQLQSVADEEGNVMSALSHDGLAPDGSHVFFRQERALVVYDFSTGDWTDIATPQWMAEGARWVDEGIWVPRQLGGRAGTVYAVDGTRLDERTIHPPPTWNGGEPYGPVRSASDGVTAQSYFLTEPLEVDGVTHAGLDAVVVSVEGRPRLLAFPPPDQRWKGCCPVAGWLDRGTLLLESRGNQPRLLAWEVPGGGVRRVTDVTGLVAGEESYVASWALPAT